jgi:hypothetical protein
MEVLRKYSESHYAIFIQLFLMASVAVVVGDGYVNLSTSLGSRGVIKFQKPRVK